MAHRDRRSEPTRTADSSRSNHSIVASAAITVRIRFPAGVFMSTPKSRMRKPMLRSLRASTSVNGHLFVPLQVMSLGVELRLHRRVLAGAASLSDEIYARVGGTSTVGPVRRQPAARQGLRESWRSLLPVALSVSLCCVIFPEMGSSRGCLVSGDFETPTSSAPQSPRRANVV